MSMKTIKDITDDQIKSAGDHYGMNITNLPIKQQKILTVMYHYREGWIDEDKLESTLRKVINNRK